MNQNNYQLLQTFRSLRDRFEKEIKLSKKNYYWNEFKNSIGDSRQTYKILNDISGKSNKNSKIPPLQSCIDENDNATDRDIADKFNYFVTTDGKGLQNDVPNVDRFNVEYVPYSMLLKKTCEKEVIKVLNNLDNKSSSGDDNISNIIVKTSAKVVAPYLSFLINWSFTKGVFPKELCKARVLPLHKDGSKLDEKNYRPISLLIVWSKMYERIMYNRIYSYLENFFLF